MNVTEACSRRAGFNTGDLAPSPVATAGVWLFPGLGCRFVGMGADILGTSTVAKELVAQANEYLGWDVVAACLEGLGRRMMTPRQEAQLIYIVSCLYAAELRDRGYDSIAVCGHSLGTWSALQAAGAYAFLDGLRLVTRVEDALERQIESGTQAMGMIIGLPEETVVRICDSAAEVYLANVNCRGQYAVGGAREEVIRVLAAALQAGAYKTKLLQVPRAMHTPLLAGMSAELGRMLDEVPPSAIRIPLVSAWDGARMTDWNDIRCYLNGFLARRVCWETTMHRLLAEGHRSFIEVGSGNVLGGMMPFLGTTVPVPMASDVLKRAGRASDPTGSAA